MTEYKNKLAIVTPAKNESNNVYGLAESVAKLEYLPDLWIFINDDSDDDTEKKFRESINTFPSLKQHCTIKIIKHISKDKSYSLGNKYSSVVKFGLDFLLKYEEDSKIKYDYIGILDCDILIPENYYSFLMNKLENDPKLGIVSGGKQLEIDSNNKTSVTFSSRTHAPSGFRVWRRKIG